MVYHTKRKKAVILAEGALGNELGKTAHDLVIFRGGLLWDIVGVIDSRHEGKDAGEVIGIGPAGIPVFSDITPAIERGAQALIIGAAPVGGKLPVLWRTIIIDAIENNMDIYNGLHEFLSDDAQIGKIAIERGVRIIDVRRPDPSYNRVWEGRVLGLDDMFRVLVAGTDCEAGKNVVTYTVYEELSKHLNSVCMIGTGQTMLMLGARGLVLDAVPSDFVAGAMEKIIIEAYNDGCRIALIEGQAAITHEAYGHVSLGILRGASPTHIIMSHVPTRKTRAAFHHAFRPLLVPSIDLEYNYLKTLNPYQNSELVGIALNTSELTIDEARGLIEFYTKTYGVPVTDPLRFGVNEIIKKLLYEYYGRRSGGP